MELTQDEKQITSLFWLSQTIQPFGTSVRHAVDYTVVRDWCSGIGEDPIAMFALLKEMAHIFNTFE